MTRKRSTRRADRRSSDETDADDLVTSYFGSAREECGSRQGRGSERALGQLRREIERTLTFGLAAARDPRLRDLVIIDVMPAPDASCFQVVVAPVGSADHAGLLDALHAAVGELRGELARSLQRKRTPELRFVLDAADGGAP